LPHFPALPSQFDSSLTLTLTAFSRRYLAYVRRWIFAGSDLTLIESDLPLIEAPLIGSTESWFPESMLSWLVYLQTFFPLRLPWIVQVGRLCFDPGRIHRCLIAYVSGLGLFGFPWRAGMPMRSSVDFLPSSTPSRLLCTFLTRAHMNSEESFL